LVSIGFFLLSVLEENVWVISGICFCWRLSLRYPTSSVKLLKEISWAATIVIVVISKPAAPGLQLWAQQAGDIISDVSMFVHQGIHQWHFS